MPKVEDTEKKSCWRTSTHNFLVIGRALAEIEQNFRYVQATAVVDNQQAESIVRESIAAAHKLVRALKRLAHTAERSAFEDVEDVED